jgi:hypothetical protein
MLSDGQRAGFRHFLGDQHYDTASEDLMLNEAQTYLVNTNDKRYFLPDHAGLTEEAANRLREIFVRGMPNGWLKAPAQASNPHQRVINDRSE